MNYKLLIGIIIVACVLFVIIKFCLPKDKPKNNPNEVEITVKMNAGIPFKWVYEIKDESVTRFVRNYVSKDENKDDLVGAPVYTNYVFKGLKKGETTIDFKLISITDATDVFKEEIYTIKVDDDLNISLVNSN